MTKVKPLPAGWVHSEWNNTYHKGARTIFLRPGGWRICWDRHARYPFATKNLSEGYYPTPELAMAASDERI